MNRDVQYSIQPHQSLDFWWFGLKPASEFVRVFHDAPFFCGPARCGARHKWIDPMKVKNSLKSLKGRHRANRLVRRRGRVYIINKVNPRFKARQG